MDLEQNKSLGEFLKDLWLPEEAPVPVGIVKQGVLLLWDYSLRLENSKHKGVHLLKVYQQGPFLYDTLNVQGICAIICGHHRKSRLPGTAVETTEETVGHQVWVFCVLPAHRHLIRNSVLRTRRKVNSHPRNPNSINHGANLMREREVGEGEGGTK